MPIVTVNVAPPTSRPPAEIVLTMSESEAILLAKFLREDVGGDDPFYGPLTDALLNADIDYI